MIKRSKKNIFYFLSIAIFAILLFASNANANTQSYQQAAPGTEGSNLHECSKTDNEWSCKYRGETYTWNVKINKDGRVKGKRFGSCQTLAEKLDATSSCIFCGLFLTIFNSIQDISTSSFNLVAPAAKLAMVLAFAIWLLLTTLPFLSSINEQNASKYIKTILEQSFKVFVCYILLSNSRFVYYWVLDTILIAGMDFSNSFLFNTDITKIQPETSIGSITTGVFGRDVFFALETTLRAIQKELGFLLAIGGSTFCIGITSLKIFMALNGAFVYFISIILLITFGFYLTDALIQLGIVGALMPILLATYPFKLTSRYAKKGFEVLMNSFFTFLILGVVVAINIKLIMQALTSATTTNNDPKAIIFQAFSENNINMINQYFNIGFAGGLALISCIVLAFKFTQQTTVIAQKLASSSPLIDKIGSTTATIGASGATNIAKRGYRGTKQSFKKIKSTGQKAYDKIKSSASRKDEK